MTSSIGWDAAAHVYTLSEETGRYAGVIGCPLAQDVSVMPYQEEPRDAPNRFVVEAPPDRRRIPVVVAGSVEGRAAARAAYDRILESIPSLYERTADHYEALDRDTIGIVTPDDRFNTAFAWAKVGIDKGLATSPLLGTGLLAGFRASGESERPGFAWFFGRDALWTALAAVCPSPQIDASVMTCARSFMSTISASACAGERTGFSVSRFHSWPLSGVLLRAMPIDSGSVS